MYAFSAVAVFAILAAAQASTIVGVPSAKILQGPSTKTTVVGPDGSAISSVAPGGQIITEDLPGVVAHTAPVVAAAPAVLAHSAPLVAPTLLARAAAPAVLAHSAPLIAAPAAVPVDSAAVIAGPSGTITRSGWGVASPLIASPLIAKSAYAAPLIQPW